MVLRLVQIEPTCEIVEYLFKSRREWPSSDMERKGEEAVAALDQAGGERAPTEKALRRRKQIVEATKRSIVKKGLSGTTLASVAKEAGLSQGITVFYFKTKLDLLAAVLRQLYEEYDVAWRAAYEAAGEDPLDQLLALVRVDFEPPVCTPDALFMWHAFWGESGSRPLYAEITDFYEAPRFNVLKENCARLLGACDQDTEAADNLAITIDALSDGLWWRLYLSEQSMHPEKALQVFAGVLSAHLPQHAQAIRQALSGPASCTL